MIVAIIGAGTMGSGISQVFAQSEIVEKLYLVDINNELAAKGKNNISEVFKKLVLKEKITNDIADVFLDKIQTGMIDIIGDADLVVEAASEDINIKKETFKKLDIICKPEAILATNTSSLSITEIGNNLTHDVIGMHFFNPAPVMKLIEVTAGLNTPEYVVDYIMDVGQKLGKKPIKIEEAPAFVVNRILIPMINEAIFIFSEGTASVEDIDTAMKLGANHPIGPLALGDMVGLDVVLAIMEVLQHETGEDKYRPAPLLRKMVRAGKLGKKTGEGFYKY